MLHMGDNFSRQAPWPRLSQAEEESGPRPQTPVTPRYIAQCDWNQFATDATNMSMYEQGIIQPKDL